MPALLATTEIYPGLSFLEALENMGGNEALLVKLVRLFLAQHAADITLIDRALQNQDWELALHLTHALRGTAATLGAMTVHDAALELEIILGTREAAPPAAPRNLRAAMAELVPSLERLATHGLG